MKTNLEVQVKAAQLLHAGPPVPAMPIIDTDFAILASATDTDTPPTARPTGRAHDDHISSSILPDYISFFCVHKAISMKDVHKTPAAKQALSDEWKSLAGKPAWDFKKVRAKADVQAEARDTGVKVHFGNLMERCHLKNSEMAP